MFGAAYDISMNTSAIVTQNLKGKGLAEVQKARVNVHRINSMVILAVRMLLNSARGENDLKDLCYEYNAKYSAFSVMNYDQLIQSVAVS